MNSGLQRLLELADRDHVRLAAAVVLAAVLCLVLLARSGDWLTARETAPHPREVIEMRLVEIAPAAAPSVAPVTRAAAAPTAAVGRRTPARTQTALTHEVASRSNPAPAPPTQESTRSPTSLAIHDEHAALAAPASTPVALAAPSNGTASAAPSGPSGSIRARVLSQPMPVLPDDLREQGYQVTAVAHFKVHVDGSFDVELVKPTQNPRLNQILLETLHRWRFFPAMENGHPVESDQDVRVHFSVS